MSLRCSLLGLLAIFAPAALVEGHSISAPTCNPIWSWATNSFGQNPCLVAAYLESVCQNNQIVIPPLSGTQHYAGPGADDAHNLCQCNTVVYCLLSACTGCQSQHWITWQEWSGNCTTTTNGTFPYPIPPGTMVPYWASQGIEPTSRWDNNTAKGEGGFPESGTPNTTHSSPDNNQASGESAHHLAVGALVGGILAGVVGLVALAGLGVWLLRRRRRSPVAPSSTFVPPAVLKYPAVDTASMYEQIPDTPPSTTPMRYYDPHDRSTFPPRFQTSENDSSQSVTGETQCATYGASSVFTPESLRGMPKRDEPRAQYSGLPEI